MKGFRVGVGTQALNTRRSPTTMVRAVYLAAVAGGVDSFWVADHLNSLVSQAIATPRYFGGARLVPKIDAQLEPWTMLGRLAASNRIGRLRLGVGVTDSGRRNPAVTAQAAATLHLLTRGRAILGIGVGEREGNEPYGVEWTKPVARFEEAVATIRALWDSDGELVSRETPHSRCTTPYLTFRPTAASGPKSGSPPTGHACCERRDAMPTPGTPKPHYDPKTMPAAWKRCARRHPTPGETRWPSPPQPGCS